MRLTLQTDYTLRVLMYLGAGDDRLVTIKEIADAYNISKNHLMKVVHQMGLAGYVITTRGKSGGMRLARKPEEINIGAVVRQSEPDMALVECFSPGGQCRLNGKCRLAGIMSEALGAFQAVLNKYTLADLLTNAEQLAVLLDIPLLETTT